MSLSMRIAGFLLADCCAGCCVSCFEASRSAQLTPLKVEGVQAGDTYVMATRDEIHRLLDGVPDDRVAAIGEILRAALEAGLIGDQAHRLAKQLRTLSAEPDLAERSEEILRTEPPGTAA